MRLSPQHWCSARGPLSATLVLRTRVSLFGLRTECSVCTQIEYSDSRNLRRFNFLSNCCKKEFVQVCEKSLSPKPSPSPHSSLTHPHRILGYHNPTWYTNPNSERFMSLSVSASRVASTPSPLPSPMVTSPLHLPFHNSSSLT